MGGRRRRLVVRGCGGRLVACIGRRSRGRLHRLVRRWGVGGVVAFGLWWTLCPFDDLLPTLRPLKRQQDRRTPKLRSKATLLLNSRVCRGLLFALLRACRRCVGLRLAPLMPLG